MRRIQRRRTRGWRMPAGAKYVGRGSRWGNPFKDGSRAECAAEFRTALISGVLKYGIADIKRELAMYDYLACWCPVDDDCHADVLIEFLICGSFEFSYPMPIFYE